MIIGILETGAPPGDLAQVHGDYPAMIARLLGPSHRYRRFDVRRGDLPDSPEACQAYVVTGSAGGVNDGLAWIAPLSAFLRSARGRARLVGLCFGHQVIAHAFGGQVEKAASGWNLGLTRYRIHDAAAALGESVCAMASHQDQVTTPPADAAVIAVSARTPYAGLAYGRDALTLQFHPEFDAGYARALIAAHRAPDINERLRGEALASMAGAADNARIGRWLDVFLETGVL